MRKLVESGADVNSVDEHGMGPLLTFTPAVTEYLLSKGADPNRQKNEGGAPVLVGVAYLNNVECVRLLLEVICWPVLAIAMLLMGPIFIVEDYSIVRGLREWLGMLRQHLGRIYLYQAIAFAKTSTVINARTDRPLRVWLPMSFSLSLPVSRAVKRLKSIAANFTVSFVLYSI